MLAAVVMYLSVALVDGKYQGSYATPDLAECQSAVAEKREEYAYRNEKGAIVTDCLRVEVPLPVVKTEEK